MKKTVINTIERLAESDRCVALITADLGYGVLDHYSRTFPNQFINVGISEQAMASVAAGMALEGHCVFTYSIGNFPTLRCIEQIRNDICYHKANVKIVAVGCGFAYGQLGMSHHATEDIAVMRSLPEMRVYSPASAEEIEACILEAYAQPGPCYIRITKSPVAYSSPGNEALHSISPIVSGEDVCIFATGDILSEALQAHELLFSRGICAAVYSVPCIKPLPSEIILDLAKTGKLIVTVEEHNIVGGLGGAVSELLAEMSGSRSSLLRTGLQDQYPDIVGSQSYLREYYGLSAKAIADRICYQIRGEHL